MALDKLEKPITGRATIRVRYRNTNEGTKIPNAALALGAEPTNEATVKVGTAIGMGKPVVFQGDWTRVGALAQVPAEMDALQAVEATVSVDLRRGTIQATLDGTHIKAKLPEDVNEIRYWGYYVKDTASDFGTIEMIH